LPVNLGFNNRRRCPRRRRHDRAGIQGPAVDDVLVAEPGRDLRIGGAGRDTLIGAAPKHNQGRSQGASILIGCETASVAKDAAGQAIMAGARRVQSC
jgi:hypothetical protein